MVSGTHKFDRGLSRLLHTELHWLDVPERVVYKLGIMVFNCLHGQASQYLVELCQPVAGVASRQHLRSATQQLLVVPRHQLSSYGRRAFCVAGPPVWNSLPDSLRNPIIGGNSFRQSLKTFLFAAYWCIQRIRGFTTMRYINRLFTYLLTSAVWCIHAFCSYSFFVAKSQLTESQDLMYFMIYIWTPFYADTWYLYSSSVCPSVRHILVLYQNGLKYRHNFFTTR